MARALTRITRKDIRRPDQFLTVTNQMVRLLWERRIALGLAGGVILLSSLGLWGWNLYRNHQNRLAESEYRQALALFHKGRHWEALAALGRARAYRFSRYSRLSHLYQANSYLAMNEPDHAILPLQEFLKRERKEPSLRQLGFLTLAYAQEKSSDCSEARKSFAEAERLDGPFKEEALLGKARCASEVGDHKEALSSYRQYLSTYPASDRATEISLRVQAIVAKLEGSMQK